MKDKVVTLIEYLVESCSSYLLEDIKNMPVNLKEPSYCTNLVKILNVHVVKVCLSTKDNKKEL